MFELGESQLFDQIHVIQPCGRMRMCFCKVVESLLNLWKNLQVAAIRKAFGSRRSVFYFLKGMNSTEGGLPG